MVRRDRYIKHYMSFIYMSLLKIHTNHALKNNLEKYI